MDNFKLNQVKLLNDGGVKASWQELFKVRKDRSEWINYNQENPIHRHPTLDQEMEKLKIHVARIFGFLAIGLYKDPEDMSKKEKEWFDASLEKIRVTSLKITHGDQAGVVITSMKEVFGNREVVLNTPFIPFEGEHYGYGEVVRDIVEEIEREVYQYLFQKKYAQLELFGGEEEESEGSSEEESEKEEQEA